MKDDNGYRVDIPFNWYTCLRYAPWTFPALEESARVEQRSVIRFLTTEQALRKPRKMVVQYGRSCMNRASFFCSRVDQFADGRKSVDTEQRRSGRPVEVSTPGLKDNIERTILTDRRATVEEILLELGASVGTVHKIIRDDLNFRKTCAICVPKKFKYTWKDRSETSPKNFFAYGILRSVG